MAYQNVTGIPLAALLVALPTVSAQPSVTVRYEQPPTVGVQFQEFTFAAASSTCAQMIVERATQRLLSEGIEVSDRQDLSDLEAERIIQATDLRGIQAATAIVVVSAARCSSDRDRTTRKPWNSTSENPRLKYIATTSYSIQGSIRLIDVSTGKVMLTEPIDASVEERKESSRGYPEFPPITELERTALDDAVEQVSAVLTTTRPTSNLLFFNDRACGLKETHRLVEGGDIERALRFLQESLESCKTTSPKKTKVLARAYHNVGVLQTMLGDYEGAHKNLRSAVQLHDGQSIKRAFDLSVKARASAARARDVKTRTREMNERLMRTAESAPLAQPSPVSARQPVTVVPPAAREAGASFDQLTERLEKLKAIFEAGLITREDYDAKKAEILSEL